jgi:integrase
MARLKGQGYIFKRGKTFYLQFEVNGKRKTLSLRTTLRREAEIKAKEFLEPALHSKSKEEVIFHAAKAKKIITASSIKLENVWKEYLQNPSRPDSSKGTLGNHERHWNNFVAWLKGAYSSKTRLSEIDENIAKEYAYYLWSIQKRKISAGTFNYHMKSLTLITRVLMSKGGLDTNPWQNITRKTEIKQQRKEFNNEQIQQIFDSFDDKTLKITYKEEYGVLFHIAAFTGLRLIDAVNLKWDSINFNRNIISLIPQKTIKTQRHVNIPIHPKLKEKLLIAYEWKDDTNKVLPQISVRYAMNASGVKKDCIKILEFCGFKDRSEGRGLDRRLYGFHSFRHFFASTCADAGVPVATLAEILGDNISTLNKYYIHAQEGSRKKMISALDNGAGNRMHHPLPSPEPERQQLIELAKEMPIEIIKAILHQLQSKDDCI